MCLCCVLKDFLEYRFRLVLLEWKGARGPFGKDGFLPEKGQPLCREKWITLDAAKHTDPDHRRKVGKISHNAHLEFFTHKFIDIFFLN